MYQNLKLSTEGAVCTLALNRPQAYNAIDEKTADELNLALDEIDANPQIHAVILTGSEKVFAAGGDIAFMASATPARMERFITKCHQALEKIEASPRPFIAAISGAALGGGCELAMACDIRIASSNAIFGQPEISLGIIPGSGGTQRLPRLVSEGRAKYLIFSGEAIHAEKALEIGLVQKVTSPEDLLGEAAGLAQKLAGQSATAMGCAKDCIHYGRTAGLPAGLMYERKAWALLFDTPDQAEGMCAFLEKRSPRYE